MLKKPAGFLGITLFCCFVLLCVSGCGKKDFPQPPEIKGQRLASPFEVTLSVKNDSVHLTWQHEIDKETAAVKPDGFEVHMARKTFETCEGCPFEFRLVGVVSLPSMTFSTQVEKGFKYYFRVRAVTDDMMKSNYSKTVQFEYQ